MSYIIIFSLKDFLTCIDNNIMLYTQVTNAKAPFSSLEGGVNEGGGGWGVDVGI